MYSKLKMEQNWHYTIVVCSGGLRTYYGRLQRVKQVESQDLIETVAAAFGCCSKPTRCSHPQAANTKPTNERSLQRSKYKVLSQG